MPEARAQPPRGSNRPSNSPGPWRARPRWRSACAHLTPFHARSVRHAFAGVAPGRRQPCPSARSVGPRDRIGVCYYALMRVLSTTPEVVGALERFGASLRSKFGRRLREVTLFGSRARGDAREDSDVDVLVVIDELSERERGEVFDLAWSAGMQG